MDMNVQELLTQGRVLIGQGKYEQAIRYLEKAEDMDNMEKEIYLQKGLAYANLAKYEEAGKEYRKVLKIDKKEGVAYFHLGNLELLAGNKAQGVEYYNNAIANGFDDAQVYYSLGLQYEEDGEDELASRNYSKALMRNPQRADVRIRKIRLYSRNKMQEEALKEASELILSNPDIFEGYHLKFLILTEMKKFAEAEQVLSEAMAMFPKDVNFVIDRASLLITQGKQEEGLALLEDAEKFEGITGLEKRKIAMEHARVFAMREDMEMTIASLEQAKTAVESVEEGNLDIEASYLLMNCHYNNNNFDKVLAYAEELKTVDDDNYFALSAYYYEAVANKRLGKTEEAEKAFREAIEIYRAKTLENPGNMDAYFFRVMCLNELEEYDKALGLIAFLEDVKGDMAAVHELKANTLARMGRAEEAEKEKRLSQSMKPKA